MKGTTAFLVLLALSAALAAGEIPKSPADIEYPKLDWDPPDPTSFRFLPDSGGSPVLFLVSDDAIPLVELTVYLPAGSADDPAGKSGLARMASLLMLRGGTEKETGDEIVRRFESRGGRLSVSVENDTVSVTAQVLSRDLGMAFETMDEILHRPAYREEEVERYRKQRRDAFRRRNDRIGVVTAREFGKLALGADHALTREETPDTLDEVTVEDLREWRCIQADAGKLVVTLAGAIPDPSSARAEVFTRFGPHGGDHLPDPQVADPPDVPDPTAGTAVHIIDRPGATQGNVRIGRGLGYGRGHPDWIPLSVMNYILGGSGFPSRITKRVRSDEGLAYSVGSRIRTSDRFGGTYSVGFQTRSAMVPFAIRLVMTELEKMRETGVTDDELRRAKAALVERFPARFETAESTASAFADLERNGLPLTYLADYRDRVRAVTKEDLLRVARAELIDPEKCVILVVGDRAAILAGDPTGKRTEKLTEFGAITE